MVINGLNKLTLLDYPGMVACTVYTGGCNLRCPFCHNASLVLNKESQPLISKEDFFAFLKKRKKVLEGVCVSGGEPTLNSDLNIFIKEIKLAGYKVKLDTNGTNPIMLNNLIESGLIDYVAMDIKNSIAKYGETVGIPNFDCLPIKKSTNILMSSKIPYEFRTTVVKDFHNKEDLIKIGEWLEGAKAYYLQQFVDSKNLIGDNLTPYKAEELYNFCGQIKKYFKICEVRGV